MPDTSIQPRDIATDNHLVASLPPAIRTLWLPHLELVDLRLGQVILGYHAEPCGRSECGRRPAHEGAVHETRVQSRATRDAPDVAVYAGIDYANGADRRLQPGLIKYARGRIRVLDRAGRERRTCECYRVVRNEYRRLLPDRAVS